MSEIETIIQKYLQGKTSEEENQHLQQWMQKSPENKKQLFAEKDILDTVSFHSNLKKYEVSSELGLLKKRIEPKQATISLKQIIQIAAILLVTFGLGWGSRFISFRKKTTKFFTVHAIKLNENIVASSISCRIKTEPLFILE